MRVQADQQARGERGDHRQREQRHRGEGEHPLVVCLAPVGVPLGRVHQQRHDDAGQDADQRNGEVAGIDSGLEDVKFGDEAGGRRQT